MLGCGQPRYTVYVYEADDWGRFSIAVQPDVEAGAEVRIHVEDTARGTATLSGTLLRADGTPIAHADVWISREPFSGGPRRTTDSEGRFVADHLPAAKYRLQLRTPEFPLLVLGIFEPGPGEQRELGDLVVASPGMVGVVVYHADGSAAQEGWIILKQPDGSLVQGFGLQEGAARSRPLESGDYSLVVWGEDVPLTTRNVTVRAGETTRLRIDLPACVKRTLVFVKPEAHPEIEVDITIHDGDGAVLSDTTGGRWPEATKAFTPGIYRVVAVDEKRGLRGEKTFVIAPGDPPEGHVEVVVR